MDVNYQTGLLWQDSQHEEWISLLSRLKNAGTTDKDPGLFHQILTFLVMYVKSHFSLEKAYMETYQYPEKRFHIEEHRLFTLRLKDFKEKYSEYGDDALVQMIDGMNEWVYSHILEDDKKLGRFILGLEQPGNKE